MKIYFHKKDLYNLEYGKKDPLFVNNFGFYESINYDIEINRPYGRADYQLIYVSNGEIKIEDKILKNGEYCIFYPHIKQNYTYIAHENCRYYWVHFTGNDLDNILSADALSGGTHSDNGRKNEVDALFSSITQAVIHEKNTNTPYICALLSAIFLLLSTTASKTPFSRAKKLLEDATIRTSVIELSKLYSMTPEHFIRSFKAAYGITPAAYRISHQILQAKSLLADTNLSIFNISDMCGFSDPYYFSRLFKKHVGITPTEYRKQFSTLI